MRALRYLAAMFGGLFLLLVAPSGCYIDWTDDGWPWWTDNWSPTVVDGDAGCVWDVSTHRDVWYFEAWVDDPDGLGDIWAVDANVYDDWHGGGLVDSFELRPTYDRSDWYEEVPALSTNLDCGYHGYSVDLVAWDSYDDYDILTVYPATY
ncbi:MAG: hypothetical protein U1F43_05465 [Myxococcota bacterium]